MTDTTHDMLADQMTRALARVTTALDALDALDGILTARVADRDDWEGLGEGTRDLLVDLGVEPDEWGEWDHDTARERVREDLEPLGITWEKGEPFDVALTLGGPNIYLVDMGGFGGAQLRGYWGESITVTGPDVTRALDYYREEMRDIFGE